MTVGEPPDYVIRNRATWDGWAREYEEPGRLNWAQDEPSWGIWSVPESQLNLFPDDVAGLDVIELGCGTGYVSAWLARRGARPVGIDNSQAQLRTARAFQREFELEPLREFVDSRRKGGHPLRARLRDDGRWPRCMARVSTGGPGEQEPERIRRFMCDPPAIRGGAFRPSPRGFHLTGAVRICDT